MGKVELWTTQSQDLGGADHTGCARTRISQGPSLIHVVHVGRASVGEGVCPSVPVQRCIHYMM